MKNIFKKNLPRTIRELEAFAKKKVPKGTFNWLNAAAENGNTKIINEEVFKKVEMIPSFFKDTSKLDLSTKFYSNKLSMPLIISPMGHQTQFHPNGEAELAIGTKSENILLSFSTQGRMPLSLIKKKYPQGKFIWDFFPFGPKKWIKEQIVAPLSYNAYIQFCLYTLCICCIQQVLDCCSMTFRYVYSPHL